MTTPESESAGDRFVLRTLPWLVGAMGGLLYLVTLNTWVSLHSLGTVARVAGWSWRPDVGHPLTFIALWPFRLLPQSWLPLALNGFTAVCAGLVLVQLARSVALWRYNVVSDDPLRQGKPVSARLSTPSAWMPSALAALVCGLQLTFWEHATSASGEMISLLCFAYAIRCLLEFRNSGAQAWLFRCAAVYAAGMADNWMLVGYAPVLLAALVWVKGFGPFLELRFLLRLLLCGMAGWSLYLVLPTLLSFSSDQPLDFGTALQLHLRSQKLALVALRSPALRLLVLTALLPALLLAVRWRSHTVQFADDTRLGVFLIKATGHSTHAVFFIASLWIALNPAFTPQNLEAGTPMLPYYYLWALITGYCAGYFLLFKSPRPPRQPATLAVAALACLMAAMPLLLVWKNLAEVRATNSSALRAFARQLCDDLPAGQPAVLSEDPQKLLLLRAELAARGSNPSPILIETPSLLLPQYHQFMARRYGTRWPDVLPTNRVERIPPASLLALASQLATHEPVFYLHPSSGFFFETFVTQPSGAIHRLLPRPSGDKANLTLPETVVAANETRWQQRWTGDLGTLAGRLEEFRRHAARWSRPPFQQLRLAKRDNPTVTCLRTAYSKSLNNWGVQLRRTGREVDAAKWFERAIELNPDNLTAHLNLEYTARGQQANGTRLRIAWVRQLFPDLLSQQESWWDVLTQDGPVDEPTFLLQTGRAFLAARYPRQAADSFARCAALAQNWPLPKLWLAQTYNTMHDFTSALELTDTIRNNQERLREPGLAQLLLCRTMALRGLGRTNEASAYLEQFVGAHREQTQVLGTAANLYAAGAQFEQELALRQFLTEQDPRNPELLTRQGLAELRSGRHQDAIATFTRALSLAPGDSNARFLRAVAHLRAGELDASKSDYEALLRKPDRSQSALFGLGSIAWRQHDTNAVLQYYQQFLSNAAALSPQFNLATERLRQLSDE